MVEVGENKKKDK